MQTRDPVPDSADSTRDRARVNDDAGKENQGAVHFADHRGSSLVQQQLIEASHRSAQVRQLMAFQELADSSPATGETAALRSVADDNYGRRQLPAQKKASHAGLPGDLKSGIETLSGLGMDDVTVHRNSDKPAQLQAHAFAQGKDIHLGPGQEHHLPHEAWHVVQQAQGRVRPTMQLRQRVPVNDDQALEQEADRMGAAALTYRPTPGSVVPQRTSTSSALSVTRSGEGAPIQGAFVYSRKYGNVGGSHEADAYYANLGFITVMSWNGYWVWTDPRNRDAASASLVSPDVVRNYAPSAPIHSELAIDLVNAPLPIQHIGNSCYLASVLTLLASVSQYRDGLFNPDYNFLIPESQGEKLQRRIHPLLLRINSGPIHPEALEQQVREHGRDGFPQSIPLETVQGLIVMLADMNILDGEIGEQQSASEIMVRLLQRVQPLNPRLRAHFFASSQEKLRYDQKNGPDGLMQQPAHEDVRAQELQHVIEVPASRFHTLEEVLRSEFPEQQRIDSHTLGTAVNSPHNRSNQLTSLPLVLTFSVAHQSNRDVLDMPEEFSIPRECFDIYGLDVPPRYKLKGMIAHSSPSSDFAAHRGGHFVAYVQNQGQWLKADDMGGSYNPKLGGNNPKVSQVEDMGRERHPGHSASTFALGSIYTYECIGLADAGRIAVGEVEIDEVADVHREKLATDFQLLESLLPKGLAPEEADVDRLSKLVRTGMSKSELPENLYDHLLGLQSALARSGKQTVLLSPLQRTRRQVALSVCEHSIRVLVNNGLKKKTIKPIDFKTSGKTAPSNDTWTRQGLSWRDLVAKPRPGSMTKTLAELGESLHTGSESDKGGDKGSDKKGDSKTATERIAGSTDKTGETTSGDTDMLSEIAKKLAEVTSAHADLPLPPEIRAELLLQDLRGLYVLSGSKQLFPDFVRANLQRLIPPPPPKMPEIQKDEKVVDFLSRITDEDDRRVLTAALNKKTAGKDISAIFGLLLGLSPSLKQIGVNGNDKLSDTDISIRVRTKYLTSSIYRQINDGKNAFDIVKFRNIVMRYRLLDNVKSEHHRDSIRKGLKIPEPTSATEKLAFTASKEEKARLTDFIGPRASEGVIKSVETRSRGLTGARGKVETLSRLEQKLTEFAKGPPLTSQSLVLDTNAMRLFVDYHNNTQLNLRDRGIFSHLLRIVKERNIDEICLPNMAYLETANHYPTILEMQSVAAAGKVLRIRGVPMDVSRTDKKYDTSFDKLGTAKVGGDKENSSADISIVNDSLHARIKKGEIPVFATNDLGILEGVWRLGKAQASGSPGSSGATTASGGGKVGDQPGTGLVGSPSVEQGKSDSQEGTATEETGRKDRFKVLREDVAKHVPQPDRNHPDYKGEEPQVSFNLATPDGRTINVVPVGDSLSQYFEPMTEKQKQLKETRDKGPESYADDIFNQLPLGKNWLLGDLFAMIRKHGGDAWISGGAVRNLQRFMDAEKLNLGSLLAHITEQKKSASDWWLKKSKEIIRDIDIVTSLTDRHLLTLLEKDPMLSSVHMEHMPQRHMVVLAGGDCEISCSKATGKDGKVDLAQVAAGQDFTVNSLFYQAGKEIQDPTGSGKEDIVSKTLKFSSHAINGKEGLVELLYQQPYLLGRLIKFIKSGFSYDKAQVATMVKHFSGAINALKSSAKETSTGADIYAIKMILTKSSSDDAHSLTTMMVQLGFSMDDVRLLLPGEKPEKDGHLALTTPGLNPPSAAPAWTTAPGTETRLNLETGKIIESRFYCHDQDGEALAVDVRYRTDPRTHEEVPYYSIWRHDKAAWEKQSSGLSESGRRGLPPMAAGIYVGDRPWKMSYTAQPKEGWPAWLDKQGIRTEALKDGYVRIGGSLTLHSDALDNILGKGGEATSRKFVSLLQQTRGDGWIGEDDANLQTFIGKKHQYRLRFSPMLAEIEDFAGVCGIDLAIEPFKQLNAEGAAGLRSQIRFYDLLHTSQSHSQLQFAHRYAISASPGSIFEYVDHFEFALSQSSRPDVSVEEVQALWQSIDASGLAARIDLKDFFAEHLSVEARKAMIETRKDDLRFFPQSSIVYHFSKHGDDFDKQLGKSHSQSTTGKGTSGEQPKKVERKYFTIQDYAVAARTPISASTREDSGHAGVEQTGDFAVAYLAHNIRTVVRVVRSGSGTDGHAYIATSYVRY